MSLASLSALAALLLTFFPRPLMWLDGLFVRFLAGSMVKASEGSIDQVVAEERIRETEGLDARGSSRVFGVIAFGATCLWGIFGGVAWPVGLLVGTLAPLTGLLILMMDRNPWYGYAAALSGLACVIAIR